MIDHYTILGVTKESSKEQITAAYRQQALKYHPDRNIGDPNAEVKFKEVAEAYEILGNPDKKNQYDMFGAAGKHSQSSQFSFEHIDVHDIFKHVFGSTTDRGSNVQVQIQIDLKEAAEGCIRALRIPKRECCNKCGGSGMESFEICPSCKGQQGMRVGPWQFAMGGCFRCNGTGRIVKEHCHNCSGTGFTSGIEKQLQIRIPQGIRNGMQIRVPGEGDASRNGSHFGDLFVQIFLKEHPRYTVYDSDICCTAWLSYTQLVLGHEFTVLDLSNNVVSVKIPPGTQAGCKFVVKGLGLPDMHGNKGDLIAVVQPEVPVEMSEEYRQAIENLALLEKQHVTINREWFVKNE